jgi:hypothetical protein
MLFYCSFGLTQKNQKVKTQQSLSDTRQASTRIANTPRSCLPAKAGLCQATALVFQSIIWWLLLEFPWLCQLIANRISVFLSI